MIDLYTAATANGHRAAVALEESGLAYRVHKLNLAAGDQKKPEYLAINPQGAIPAIVDQDGPGGKPLTLAQSGAIVLYLAEKSGRLMPKDPARRAGSVGMRRPLFSDRYSTIAPDCASASGLPPGPSWSTIAGIAPWGLIARYSGFFWSPAARFSLCTR